jgi:heat shock protein HslJ
MLTRMACAPEIMTVENAAVRVLDGEATYEVDGATLTITKGDQKLQLTGQ